MEMANGNGNGRIIRNDWKVNGRGGTSPPGCVCVCPSPRPRKSHNPGPAGLARWPRAWPTGRQQLITVDYGLRGQCTNTGRRKNNGNREILEILEIQRESVDFLKKRRKAAPEQCWWCLQHRLLYTITCPRRTCQQAACRTAA